MLDLITYYVTFGKIHFVLFFLALLFIYLLSKALILGINLFLLGQKDRAHGLKTIGRISASIAVSVVIFFLFIGIALEGIATTHSPQEIAKTNEGLMSLDRSIFGVYPFAWVQETANPAKPFFDKLAGILVNTYASLSLVLGLGLVLVLLKNGRLFYRFVLAFSTSLIISLPIWHFAPAIPPIDGYIDNITGSALPDDVQVALSSYNPNPTLASALDAFRTLRNDYLKSAAFAVTTMPSMHVAWAALILYFGILAWTPLTLILIPYFLLNLASTVYVAQHYAVDALAGALVAVLAIVLSSTLTRFGVPKIISDLHELIRNDIDAGIASLKRALSPGFRNL